MSTPGARRIWLNIHLYLGLFAGFVLALFGLTGSVLVFSDEIDGALNPGLAAPSRVERFATPDEVAQTVRTRTGQYPYMIEQPTHGRPHYLAFVNESQGRDESLRALIVDGSSGAVLADRRWGGYFVSFARRLHTELLLGESGHFVVGLLGIIGLVSLATGLYLWWPRVGGFRKALAFRWHRHATAFNFELHRISGFYLLIVLFVITASGIYLAMPEPFVAAVDNFAHVTPYPEAVPAGVPAEPTQPLSLAKAADIVSAHAPGAVVTGFYVPSRPDESYAVYYRGADEPFSDFGRSALWIDRYTGRVQMAREYAQSSTADRAFALQILLHNGEIAGSVGRWLVFIAGLALPLLYVTGFYLWWVRRRPQQRAAAVSRAWASNS
jgi:uncharacterized iron-regulated membrane protein